MKIRKYIVCAGVIGLVGLSSGCGQKADSAAASQTVKEQTEADQGTETAGSEEGKEDAEASLLNWHISSFKYSLIKSHQLSIDIFILPYCGKFFYHTIQ